MKLILRLIINIILIILIAKFVPGIFVANIWTAVLVAIVLGIINVTLKPILVILTLPITILTLGLFSFILNALLLLLVAWLVPGFEIAGFIPALIGSLIISLVHFVTHSLKM